MGVLRAKRGSCGGILIIDRDWRKRRGNQQSTDGDFINFRGVQEGMITRCFQVIYVDGLGALRAWDATEAGAGEVDKTNKLAGLF